MKYFWPEKYNFLVCTLILLIGQTADFTVPLVIGIVMTKIEEGKLEEVAPLCWKLFIIIIVSNSNN